MMRNNRMRIVRDIESASDTSFIYSGHTANDRSKSSNSYGSSVHNPDTDSFDTFIEKRN